MIIDSHVHLLPRRVRLDRTDFCRDDIAFCSIYSSEKSKMVSEEEIVAYMDRSEIDKAIVFGFPWENHDLVRENNDEVWSFHLRFPDRIVPFAVLSPRAGESAWMETERTLSSGFSGLGELAVYHGGWNFEGFQALGDSLNLAQTYRVPVLIHVNEPVGHDYPGKIPVDFGALFSMIKGYSDLDFILAHFGGGAFVWALMPEIRDLMARTYLDTAAAPFLYDSKIFEIACRIMGPEKILFGSDYPLLPLSRYLKEIEKTDIPGDVRARILGGNAAELLLGRR